MSAGRLDMLVIGSTPLARLLAGLLAREHKRRVGILIDNQSKFRLPRQIDLSVAPVTRPDSWALLSEALPETLKLLRRIGAKPAMARIDPVFFADQPIGRQALSFMHHTASGLGRAIERTASGSHRDSLVLPDSVWLDRPRLEPILDKWLDRLKVERLDQSETAVTLETDGRASIVKGSDVLEADLCVLADDEAICAHCPEPLIDRQFWREPQAIVLTEATRKLAAPVMLQVETGLWLTQNATRAILAMGPGEFDQVTPRLGALLRSHHHLRRVGQSRHVALVSRDGAPQTGRVEGGPIILAALGPIAAFLAPGLARWIAGQSATAENAYFAARAPERPLDASVVAEWMPEPPVLSRAA